MNAKAAAITLIVSLALLAAVLEWGPRRQQAKPGVQMDARGGEDEKPYSLAKTWLEDHEGTGKGRHNRAIITELELRRADESDLQIEEEEEEVPKPVQSRKKYSLIYPVKRKNGFKEKKSQHEEIAELFAEGGSGLGSTNTPPETVTSLTVTDNLTPEGSGDTTTEQSTDPFTTTGGSNSDFTSESHTEHTELYSTEVSKVTELSPETSAAASEAYTASQESETASQSPVSLTSSNDLQTATEPPSLSSATGSVAYPTVATGLPNLSPTTGSVEHPTVATGLPSLSPATGSVVYPTVITGLPNLSPTTGSVEHPTVATELPNLSPTTGSVEHPTVATASTAKATTTQITPSKSSSAAPTNTFPTITHGETTRPPSPAPGTTPKTTSLSVTTTVSTATSSPTTTTTTPTTTKSNGKPEVNCQNGGIYDGNKCICPSHFFGPLCEQLLDEVPVADKLVNTSVKVIVKIISKEFKKEYKDKTSKEYKEFVNDFKDEMKEFYKHLRGYKDVEVFNLTEGSIDVDHNVIVEAEYNDTLSIHDQYEDIFHQVNTTLEELKEKNCFNENSSFCVDASLISTFRIEPLSEEEICKNQFDKSVSEFYRPVITDTGLVCVTDCNPTSKDFLNCNHGVCQVKHKTGPSCLCEETETYLYTVSRCRGRVLKAGLYGGIGAAIAVLVLIIAIVVFLMMRQKKKRKQKGVFKDNDNTWCEENESEWSAERGFTNMTETLEEADGASSNQGSYSGKERFKPDLKNIDTNIQVKIQRPKISSA